jgi:choline dehydrogenase-like flavoprotein
MEADVIVVGSGSAGAALTRRLVDVGASVLLVEAGGEDTNEAIHNPHRAADLWLGPEDWGYHTVPQEHANGRRLHWPRGKVLGGSSSLNGMIWVRGAKADWDHWAYLGNDGWSWEDVLPVFMRIEESTGGPQSVFTEWQPDPIQESVMAAIRAVGVPFNPDYNSGTLDGAAWMQLTLKDGRRQSAADAYLRPVLDRPGLTLLTRAHARRLVIEGGRCSGLEFERDGRVERASAGEIVVCAGTIESPRLLMLSGIGPAEHLSEHGIGVVEDLPGVGSDLHDHILSPVIFSAEREIGPPSPGLPTNQVHFWSRSRPGLVAPDLQPLHFQVPLYEEWMEGPPNGFSLMAGMVRPASRGRIRLTGPDPWDELSIDPATLACESDLEGLEAAVELCREIGRTEPLREWGAREVYPGPDVSTPADLRDWVRRTVITYHHQVGTCKMGVDADAVVDPVLRVRGIEGLRVADASVMPAVTSGNTHAPSILIGERAADFVQAA